MCVHVHTSQACFTTDLCSLHGSREGAQGLQRGLPVGRSSCREPLVLWGGTIREHHWPQIVRFMLLYMYEDVGRLSVCPHIPWTGVWGHISSVSSFRPPGRCHWEGGVALPEKPRPQEVPGCQDSSAHPPYACSPPTEKEGRDIFVSEKKLCATFMLCTVLMVGVVIPVSCRSSVSSVLL